MALSPILLFTPILDNSHIPYSLLALLYQTFPKEPFMLSLSSLTHKLVHILQHSMANLHHISIHHLEPILLEL
jgi:hypothetical protein